MTDTPSREGRGEIRERRRPPEPRIVRAPSWGVLLPALLLLPGALTGQVPEEKSCAPEQMLGCDFTFAVFAPARGEPRTVRRCPGADGGPFFFARSPVVDLTHLDSVAAAPAGAGSWRVDARLTGEGARRLEEGVPEDGIDPVGIVLDGRVVSRFTPRSAVRSDRLVVLDGVSEARAREVSERLRTEAWRASARRDGGLCRLLRHLRPGGALDRAYREEREELMEVRGDTCVARAHETVTRRATSSRTPCGRRRGRGLRREVCWSAGSCRVVRIREGTVWLRPDGTSRITATHPRGC